MWRVLIPRIAQLLAVASPVLVPALFKKDLNSIFHVSDSKDAERWCQVFFMGVALALLQLFDYFEFELPRIRARKFGTAYVGRFVVQELCDLGAKFGDDIRLNVLVARRIWWTLFLVRRFEWFVTKGFRAQHPDNRLWLCTKQGLAGLEFSDGRGAFLDTRELGSIGNDSGWPDRGNFYLFSGQRAKTRHLKALMSVQMAREKPGPVPVWQRVGVINVDAVSDLGAEWLKTNRDAVGRLLQEHGQILAQLL